MVAALLFVQYQGSRVALRASVERHHARLTERTAAVFEDRLQALSELADGVAASLDEAALRDKPRLQQRLAQLTLVAPHAFRTLSVTDLNGYPLAWVPATTGPQADASVADRSYFSGVLATQSRVIVGPVLSRSLRTHVTIFSSPIYGAEGKVVGVVVGSIENIALAATAGLGDFAGGPASLVTVASEEGTIIAQRNADRMGESVRTLGPMAKLFTEAEAPSGLVYGMNADGVPSLMYVTTISGPSSPWRLVMEAPVSKIFTDEAELRWHFLVVLSVGTALLPLLWLTIRAVLQPLRVLHRQVAAVSLGNTVPAMDTSGLHTSDELELAEAVRTISRASTKSLSVEEAETTRLRTALHNVDAGVLVVDCESRITTINQVAARLLGWRVSDALNRPLDQVYQPRLRASGETMPSLHPALLSAKTALRRVNTLEAVSRDGKAVPLSEASVPVFLADGSTAGAVIVIRGPSAAEVPAVAGVHLRDETTGLRRHCELQSVLTKLFNANGPADGHHAVITMDMAGCGDQGPNLGQLRNAGKAVRETLRMGDRGFRWTEASLLLVLKNCDLPEAAFLAEDVLGKLRASDAQTAPQVSVGVLAFGPGPATWTEVVQAATRVTDAARRQPGAVYIAPESNGAGMLDALGDLFGQAPAA
ncbi:putative diguanylate cyclase DgcE (plasmid) [Variovorax sp. WDL1]|nr:putative diguanylate cyclase YegE [Variovorax sp. B2]PNG50814.1 putative diguanylate cyclase YegE [Variovorax sp. B4]VTV18035.1 putative diguanylate cyclase DgcE [Variovorax sp. WDL1]